MPAAAPSAHAARTGSWALIVALAVGLAFDVGRRTVMMSAVAGGELVSEWLPWMKWFGDADLPLHAALTALAALGFLRLYRGTAEAGAKGMFLGSCLLWLVGVGALLVFNLEARADYQAVEAWVRTFHLVALALERLAAGLLLAALWRARRAWGQPVGLAWAMAALLFVLRLALIVGAAVIDPGPVEPAALVRRELMVGAFQVTEVGTLLAALAAFARAAPAEPEANRLGAAAAGLDTYFRGLVARVTIVLVGAVVTLAFGLTSPATRGKLLFGTLVLALPTVLVQLAGLTRYADAPTRIGRGWLGLALAGIGGGLALEVLLLTAYAAALWGGSADRLDPSTLQLAGLGGQLLAFVASLALVLSLRRAAISLEAPALQQRASKLGVTLVALVVLVGGLLFWLGETLARAPWLQLMLGLVALVIGVVLFISWLRLVEGVAAALRERAGPK